MKRRLLAITVLAAVGFAAASFAQERFDNLVRDDMFRGFAGNEAAFKSAVSAIDEKLRENPDYAAALVWRGAARYFQAGRAFRAGDIDGGRSLATDAMADLDRASASQPNSIEILIPRAVVLLSIAKHQTNPQRARNLAVRAAAEFEAALAIQLPVFDRLGLHSRGEFLSGLAESWALAGDRGKAEGYLRRILAELPNSPYAERATAKLADWSDPRPVNCQTCH